MEFGSQSTRRPERDPERARGRARRVWAVGVSATAHVAVALLILAQRFESAPPVLVETPIEVVLVQPRPRAAPAPTPGAEAGAPAGGAAAGEPAAAASSPPQTTPQTPPDPAPPTPTARPLPVKLHRPPTPRPSVAPPPPATVPVAPAPAAPTVSWIGLSDAEMAAAQTAGSGQGAGSGGGSGTGAGTGSGAGGQGGGAGAGSGGGDCDMIARLQEALQDDARIRAAAAEAQRAPGMAGRAIVVWNGDWVLTPGQAGKGLAGVRQAIAVEVAFAPAACRAQAMRGHVVLRLGDQAGAPKIALGAAHWRWSDLLGRR